VILEGIVVSLGGWRPPALSLVSSSSFLSWNSLAKLR
jgi:hypothetical protein